MNSMDYYHAEVAYRREQLQRSWAPVRRWRRTHRPSASNAPTNRTR